jgi:hypothetical protein
MIRMKIHKEPWNVGISILIYDVDNGGNITGVVEPIANKSILKKPVEGCMFEPTMRFQMQDIYGKDNIMSDLMEQLVAMDVKLPTESGLKCKCEELEKRVADLQALLGIGTVTPRFSIETKIKTKD